VEIRGIPIRADEKLVILQSGNLATHANMAT